MNLLNAGCGTHYAQGWVNTDVWESETTKPDVRVVAGEPYPFDENTFDAVFLGHVLEHMDWKEVPAFLNDMSRVAKPDAPFFVIGPDVFRTILRWRDGHEPFWMIESVMEHQDVNVQPDREHEWWDGAAHHWNCHEARVKNLLEAMGFPNIDVVSDDVPNGNKWRDPHVKGLIWPVIGKAPWQFAIRCTNKM